jgi:hypothetical protein
MKIDTIHNRVGKEMNRITEAHMKIESNQRTLIQINKGRHKVREQE